jgi:anti-sigma factor RsiW
MEARPASCEQAAQLASLDLDGELSRFERALLDRHLTRCPRCAAEVHRIAVATAMLRSQALEQVTVPVDLPRRRSRLAVVQSAVAVATVAVAGVWLGVTMADRRTDTPLPRITPEAASVSAAAASGDRFDWQAGPVRGPRFVQFVPGGLRMSDS